MAEVDVTITGPLFDGRAQAAMTAFLDEADQEIGQQVVDDVRRIVGGSARHSSGYYENRVHTERRGDLVATDGGVIYGPWLEGVSRRNRSSSFKGFHAFRRARQAAERQAPAIAERVLGKYLGRMT